MYLHKEETKQGQEYYFERYRYHAEEPDTLCKEKFKVTEAVEKLNASCQSEEKCINALTQQEYLTLYQQRKNENYQYQGYQKRNRRSRTWTKEKVFHSTIDCRDRKVLSEQ